MDYLATGLLGSGRGTLERLAALADQAGDQPPPMGCSNLLSTYVWEPTWFADDLRDYGVFEHLGSSMEFCAGGRVGISEEGREQVRWTCKRQYSGDGGTVENPDRGPIFQTYAMVTEIAS